MIKPRSIFAAGLVTAAVFCVSSAGCTSTKDIGVLADLAKDEKHKEEVIKEETARYEKIKAAYMAQKLQAGMMREEILNRFGEPVITTREGDQTRLAYKHGKTSWFDDEKMFLYFDGQEKLVRIVSAQNPGA